ncbi:MAG: hypothetical protein IJ091_00055 [Oscillospiraceae bacterium]|nr:hypothetical protein [Oscillospiraceae bacterium]
MKKFLKIFLPVLCVLAILVFAIPGSPIYSLMAKSYVSAILDRMSTGNSSMMVHLKNTDQIQEKRDDLIQQILGSFSGSVSSKAKTQFRDAIYEVYAKTQYSIRDVESFQVDKFDYVYYVLTDIRFIHVKELVGDAITSAEDELSKDPSFSSKSENEKQEMLLMRISEIILDRAELPEYQGTTTRNISYEKLDSGYGVTENEISLLSFLICYGLD